MSSTSLIQTKPLSQSRYEQMACGFGYRAVHVHGVGRAANLWSESGKEAHDIISAYIEHLVSTRQATDLDYFDALAVGASPNARDGLARIREGLVIDPEKVLGTEQYIGLDGSFHLVIMEHVRGEHFSSSDPRIEHEGTLDLVLMDSPEEAEIVDWKNYFQITAPDTFQAHHYPLLLFSALPSLKIVRFRLEFLRWGSHREVTFTRDDLPRLKRAASAARNRQRKLTWTATEPKATPHKGCIYCPLLTRGCPIEKVNPYGNLSPQERLRYQMYLDAARDANLELLKQWAEQKPISVRDENRVTYTGSFVPRTRTTYRLETTLPIVDTWDKEHPEDRLRPQLLIGASELNGLAKATKKRPFLLDTLRSVAEVTSYSEFQISSEAPKSRTKKRSPKSTAT